MREGWLEYLIASNPQGVMSVLYKNGYTGYLAPQDQDELYEAALDLIESKGDSAIIELIKAHPLYEIVSDIADSEKKPALFKNADGSGLMTTIQNLDYRKLIETGLILIGILYVADKLWSRLTKE